MKKSQCLLRVLFDHRRALPADVAPTKLTEEKIMTTLAGKFKTTEVVTLRKNKLPEFDKTKTVHEQVVSSTFRFHNDCPIVSLFEVAVAH